MISYTEQQTQYGDLSQNTTSANLSRGSKLANAEHRYLLQKYFNNEGSFQITTVGSQSLTTTGALSANAVSATLTVPWAYHTTTANVTFSNGDYRQVNFIRNSTSITWTAGLSATATTALTVGGLQFYPAPPNYSKLKTVTITIGNLKWTPKEIFNRQEWDSLNVFPYYADIPNNFFVYPGGDKGGQVGIYPIPSTTGNVITYNYKFRIPDLSMADYNTDTTNGNAITGAGTITATNGSMTITGSSTVFVVTNNAQLESRWIRIPQPSGDNLWYQIASVDSTTSITLYQPYQGITVEGATYTIGQMPLLMEDFQDMLVWKPLIFYYSTIVSKPEKVKEYEELYAEKKKQLDEYAGSKTINVNLSRTAVGRNPNLYPQSLS